MLLLTARQLPKVQQRHRLHALALCTWNKILQRSSGATLVLARPPATPPASSSCTKAIFNRIATQQHYMPSPLRCL